MTSLFISTSVLLGFFSGQGLSDVGLKPVVLPDSRAILTERSMMPRLGDPLQAISAQTRLAPTSPQATARDLEQLNKTILAKYKTLTAAAAADVQWDQMVALGACAQPAAAKPLLLRPIAVQTDVKLYGLPAVTPSEPAPGITMLAQTNAAPGKSKGMKTTWDSILEAPKAQGSKSIVPGSTLVQTEEKPSTSGGSAALVEPKKRDIESRECSVVCSEAPMAQVLAMLAESAKTNIVLITPTENLVTIRLQKATLGEALKYICSLSGLEYLNLQTSLVVGSPEKLKASYPVEYAKAHPDLGAATNPGTEPANSGKPEIPVEAPPKTVVQTYSVNYVLPASLITSLNTFFEGTGLKVVEGPTPKSPTLTGGSSSGVQDGGSGGVQTGSSGGSALTAKTIVLRGPEAVVEEALKTAKMLDIKRKQVAIAVTIHDISDNALKELGMTYTPGGTSVTEGDPRGLNFGSFVRSPLGFNVAISAMENADKAKLLARPNITVMDQESAYILIGSKITLPKLESVDQGGRPTYSAVEYRVGIYLQVAPQISDDGEITLSLYPQVSTITGFNLVNGGSYPTISTREANTTLTVKSGETIMMGGLMKDEELQSMTKVPILGDIPIIKEIFSHRKRTKGASQVIISITPLLVSPK